MPTDEERDRNLQQRSGDALAPVMRRLESLELALREQEKKVIGLDTVVSAVKMQQDHIKEIFDLRFQGFEESQRQNSNLLTEIKGQIAAFADGPEKSPTGRVLQADIREVATKCTENGTKISELETFKRHAEGVMFGVKFFLAPSTAVALIIMLFRALMGMSAVP